MKEVLFEIFGVTGIVLMVFAMFASILYLARCMVADTADFYDYFQHRTEFQMWKWVKEREEGEALEIQEQRCLEKLKEIRREKIRRDGGGRPCGCIPLLFHPDMAETVMIRGSGSPP